MNGRWNQVGLRSAIAVLSVLVSTQLVAGEEPSRPASTRAANGSGESLIDSFSLTSNPDPIHISSRHLEFLYSQKRIVYNGDVVVTQGDVTLKADRLVVTYDDTADNATRSPNSSSRQRLKKIVAEGNVEITSGDRRATSETAIFDETKRTVVLAGNAVLREGPNQVTGEKVTVFLDEKRSVVEGGSDGRAEMVFTSKDAG